MGYEHKNVHFLMWLREKLEVRNLEYLDLWWNLQVGDRLVTVEFANKMQFKTSPSWHFLGHLRKERYRGRSLTFPKRPRNDGRGNISFSEVIANPSGGWVVRCKQNWPWELGTWIAVPAWSLTGSAALSKSLHHTNLIFFTCQEKEMRSLPFKHPMSLWEAASSDDIRKRRIFLISSYCLCHHRHMALLKHMLSSWAFGSHVFWLFPQVLQTPDKYENKPTCWEDILKSLILWFGRVFQNHCFHSLHTVSLPFCQVGP